MITLIVLSIGSLKIKIIGIFVIATIAFIVKEFMKENIEKENAIIENLVSKFKNKNNTQQSILLDEFVFATYDGFFQNFSSGNSDENLHVKIFSDKFEFTHLNCSLILQFKHIYNITFLTEQRGRHDAIVDKYIKLSFNEDDIIYLNKKHESNTLTSLVNRWRIRKSNGKVYGNTGFCFEEKLIQTFEKYLEE